MIFGSLVVAVPAGVPTLGPAVEPGLAMEGARDLVRAVGPDPELAQEVEVVELIPGLHGVAAPGRGTEPGRDSERVVVLDGEVAPDWVAEAAQDLERAVEPVPTLDLVTVLGRGAERDQVAALAEGAEADRVVETGRVQAPGPSLPQWADGSLPRHY
jgi:hypothetical protein